MSNSEDLQFLPTVATMKAQAEALRRDGVDLVVVVMHADRKQGVDLVETHAADVILTGHNHDLFIEFDGRTLMVESAYDAQYVTVIDLHIETKQQGNQRNVDWWPQFRVVDTATVTPDPEIAAIVAGFQQELDRQMNVPLTTTAVELDSRNATVRGREAAIGNLIADAMRERTRADAAIMNGGGIRGGKVYEPGTRDHPPRRAGRAAVRQSSGDARRQGQRPSPRHRERPVAAARRRRAVSAGVRHDGRVRSAAAGRQPRARHHRRRRAARPDQDLPDRRSTISWRAAATAIRRFADVEPLVPLEDTPLLSDEVMVYLRGLGSVQSTRRRPAHRQIANAAAHRCAAASLQTNSAISGRREAPGGDAGGDAQTGLGLAAQRLQRDGVARAADQRIGADADADRGARLPHRA